MDTLPKQGDRIKLCDLKTNTDLNGICGTCIKVLPIETYDPYRPNNVNKKPSVIIRLDFKFKEKYTFKIQPHNYCVGISCPLPTQNEMNSILNFTKNASIQENTNGSITLTSQET
jgi:hypothetical protein